MKAADREERRGAVVVVLAAGALGSEGADHVGSDLADELNDIGGDALRRGRREAAVGPLEETSVFEADHADGVTPLPAAFRGELRRRPRSALLPEPHAHITACECEERR